MISVYQSWLHEIAKAELLKLIAVRERIDDEY